MEFLLVETILHLQMEKKKTMVRPNVNRRRSSEGILSQLKANMITESVFCAVHLKRAQHC